MAKGIQDLGIGLGYLYKTKPDGVTIVAVEKNTADGVRSMKTQGTTNGPVIADRPAVGTITVNSVASVGAITAITIGGVNQIGANINVVSSTASVVAAQIADAINRYSPVGTDDFTAQAVGAIVYVFSPSNTGSTSNGLTITVTATDPSINTSTTPLNNGSSQNAVYDTIFGYRFFIDADYGSAGTPGGGTATPSSLTYAAEITQYITLRGLQSGIFTTTATIASDSITSLTRCSAITQVLVSNQGGAATDVLAFIQTEGFAVGDEIQLSSAAPGTQVPTLEDANVTTSTVGTPNLYLTDEASFVMDSYTSITLQLRNIPSTGLAWVETGRSLADGVITTTVAGIGTLSGSSSLRPKGLYFITDLGDAGTYVQATSSTLISSTGYHIRRVPQNYTGCWRASMAAPTVGQYYRYYQNVYQSVTGAIGTAPDTDTVNWLLIAKTNNVYYQSNANFVGLPPAGLLSNGFIFERDNLNNFISQSAAHRSSSGVNAYNVFSWRINSSTAVHGNTVIDAVFDCANSDGSIIENTVTANANFSSNVFASGSVLSLNRISGGAVVTGNFVTAFIGNTIYNESTVTNNGTSGAVFYQISYNDIVGGTITNNTSATAGDKEIVYTRVEKGSAIQNNVFRGNGSIAYCTVKEGSAISGCTLYPYSGTRNLSGVEVSGGATLTIIDATTSSGMNSSIVRGGIVSITPAGFQIIKCAFYNSTLTLTLDGNLENTEIHNSTMTATVSSAGAIVSGVSTTGTPTLFLANVFGNVSGMEGGLDLDDPAVFAAGVLTIGSNLQLCSSFGFSTTANRNITSIVGLPAFNEVRFYSLSTGNTITFTTTGKATVAGNQIVGSAASYVLASNATGALDQLWMNKLIVNTVTRASILI